MSEKKMAKCIAGCVACMDEDITQLMNMNACEQQSKLKKDWNMCTKAPKAIKGLKELVKMNCK